MRGGSASEKWTAIIGKAVGQAFNTSPHQSPSSKMAQHIKPRRRLSFSRLKRFAAALIFAILTYRYVYRGLALQYGSKPRDAAGNATLGVSLPALLYLRVTQQDTFSSLFEADKSHSSKRSSCSQKVLAGE